MRVHKLIENNPDLLKITTEVLDKCWSKVMGDDNKLDYTQNYHYQGADGLDMIEVVMEIEKYLDIYIDDNEADALFSEHSSPLNIMQYLRDSKLTSLGI